MREGVEIQRLAQARLGRSRRRNFLNFVVLFSSSQFEARFGDTYPTYSTFGRTLRIPF